MTRPPRYAPEPAPDVTATALVRTSAGVPVEVTVTVTNRAAEARVFSVSAVGADSAWLPAPSRSRPVEAGESIAAVLTLRPTEGTVPARYPLAIAVQALDPMTGLPRSATSVSEVELVVGAPGQIVVTLDPPDATAVYSTRFHVVLSNAGQQAETVHLDASAPSSTAVDLSRGPFVVAPGTSVRVPGRLTVARPTLFRRSTRHAFSVSARSSGAPRYAEGSLTARSVVGPTGAKVIAVLVVISLWVTLALFFVPKLADSFKKPQNQAAGTTTLTAKPAPRGKSGGSAGSGGTGGSAQQPDGGAAGGGGGAAGGGAAGGGAAGTAGSGKPATVQLNGTVSGASPQGVVVSLSPTSLGAQDSAGATPLGTAAAAHTAIGKIASQSLASTALSQTSDRSVQTGADGAWSFADVAASGYYVLQFAKAGYQTQRYIIDAASAVATDPLTVSLVPGTGSLHGVVHNAAGGNVGAATVTISDGTNSITTSTVSKGSGIGTWSVNGLSTPSSYLVSASHDGLGTASRLVDLAASGSRSVDLTMASGIATLTGYVHTFAGAGDVGLGGVQVTATNGTDQRTASTVTTGTQQGVFTLPNLTLGTWIVTVQADGYQVQTRPVTVTAGRTPPPMNLPMSPSTVTVSGAVYGGPGTKNALEGAGMTLSNTTNTYKQTAVRGGGFEFDNVAPGTYSLTAEYFGYDATAQTVIAEVGKPVTFSTLHLGQHVTTNDSTIAGYAGNAAGSSGSFGCETDGIATAQFPLGTPTVGCLVYFALTDSDGAPVPATVSDRPNAAQSFEAVSANGPTPYLLAKNPKEGDGLKPGRYKLTISSPGYLPATVALQVPLNGVASAPQVALFPANALAGKVTVVSGGAINQDGQPAGTGAGDNCVVAVPIGYDAATFSADNFMCDQAKADAAGELAPSTIATLQKICTDQGTAEPGYGVIDDSGGYKVPGLCDGQYVVHLVLGNAAYDQDAGVTPTQTVLHGQTLEYSPHVPRRPVIAIATNSLDGDTGDITPIADDTPVTVSCTTAGTPGTTVSAPAVVHGGIATIWGVHAGDVQCSVTPLSGPEKDLTAGTGSFGTIDDATYSASAVLVRSLPTIFGSVVSTFATSDTNLVPRVTVNVRGIVGYVGSTPRYETRPVTTNANGCYAVLATGGSLGTPPTACGTLVDGTNTVTMDLTSKSVTVDVASGPGTAASAPKAITLDTATAPAVPVTALAVSTAGLTFSTVPPGLPLNGAVLTLHDFATSAKGAGTVSASVNGTGQLVWLDSAIGAPDQAWQGTYSFDLTVPGFADTLGASLACGLSDTDTTDDDQTPDPTPPTLGCTLTPASVDAFGELRGTVTAPTVAGRHDSVVPVAGATVIAVPCGGTTDLCANPVPADSTCPQPPTGSHTATTDSAGAFDFIAPSGRFLTTGTYELIACAGGKITTVAANRSVSGGYNKAEDTAISMPLLGGVSGTVLGGDNNQGRSGATVTLYSCDALPCVPPVHVSKVDQTTTDGSGYYQFSGAAGRYYLDPGAYRLTFSAPGFIDSASEFLLSTADTTDPSGATSTTLTALGGLSGHITSGYDTTPIAKAVVTVVSCTGTDPSTCATTGARTTTTDANGNYEFTDGTRPYFLVDGEYQVAVTATGYAAKSDVIHIGAGSNGYSQPLTLLGGAGGVVTSRNDTTPIGAAVVSIVSCTGSDPSTCVTSGARTTTTDGGGHYQFTDGTSPYFLTAGYWQVSVRATGFAAASQVISVASGITTYSPALDQLGSLSGQITESSHGAPTDGSGVAGATVIARLCTTDATRTCTGPASPAVAFTTKTDASGQYTFLAAGSPNIFAAGVWRLDVTAAGYLDATTTKEITTGANAKTVPMTALGSLSGIISGTAVAGATQQLSGAKVVATACDATGTTCTGTTETAFTDGFGKYTLAGSGVPWLLAPGYWQITASEFGYADRTRVVSIDSGRNTLNLTEDVRLATQAITVHIVGSTASDTKHAKVVIISADPAVAPQEMARSGSTYTATGLIPSSYTVQITGDSSALGQSIVPTTATINVPLVGISGIAAPQSLSVLVVRNIITGSVALPTGATATAADQSGITVQLVIQIASGTCPDGSTPSAYPAYCAALDNADAPINTSTAANGSFSLGGVPLGSYLVRINGPDPKTGVTPANGYQTLVTNQVDVGLGQTQPIGTQTLTAVTHNVTVTVDFDASEGTTMKGAPGKLTAQAPNTWATQTLPTPTSTAPAVTPTSATYTFTGVPFGCWRFSLDWDAATHPGSVTTTNTDGCATANSFAVSTSRDTSSAADESETYTLQEHQLSVTPVLTANNPVDAASSPGFMLLVKDSTGHVRYQDTNVTATTTAATMFVTPDSYTLSLTVNAPVSPLMWPAAGSTVDVQATRSVTIKAVEAKLAGVTVAAYPGVTLDATHTLAITATCTQSQDVPVGCATAATAPTATDSGSGATLSGLAPGTWNLHIEGKPKTGKDVSADRTVTLTAGKTATATWP